MEKHDDASIFASAKNSINGDLIKPAKIRKGYKSLQGKVTHLNTIGKESNQASCAEENF